MKAKSKSKVKIKIEVTRYTDPQGNPTCAINFAKGEVCEFYRTQRFGTLETCLFAKDNGKYYEYLGRRFDNGKTGSLIPCENCLVWRKKGRNEKR